MMPARENLYYFQGPIKEAARFFGRRRELRTILQEVYGAVSLWLVGERKCGKTSLLYRVLDPKVQAEHLPADHPLVFVYVDCGSGIETLGQLFHEAFRRVAVQEPSFSFEQTRELDRLQIRDCIDELAPKHLVLLLDNFDYVATEHFSLEDLNVLKEVIISRPNISIVVASRPMGTKSAIELSPFFTYVRREDFGSFTQDEFEEFIQKTSAQSGVQLEDYQAKILDLAGHFPYFIQLACSLYFEAITEQRFEQVGVHAAIRQEFTAQVQDDFALMWGDLNPDEREVLRVLAEEGSVEETFHVRRLRARGYIVENRLLSSAFKDFVMRQRVGQEPATS